MRHQGASAKRSRSKAEKKLALERAAKTKIERLTREITQIDRAYYGPKAKDLFSRAYDLRVRRDDIVRAAVLHLHTSIEELVDYQIAQALLKVAPFGPSKQAMALRRMLSGSRSLGFDMKLNLTVALGEMSEATRRKLMELNTLRNRCSHYHTLKDAIRRGRRPSQSKPPLLNFRGKDLHTVKTFSAFADEYSDLRDKIYRRGERTLRLRLSAATAGYEDE